MKALKISLLVLAILIIGILALLYITSLKAPDSYLEKFRAETADLAKNKVVQAYPPEILEKRTTLDARLAMSNDDSIGMRINLKEKQVYLEIQGIVLTQSPILDYEVSHFLRELSPAEKYFMFHQPLTIQRDESTIFKDRFKEIIAPPVRKPGDPEPEPAPKDTAKAKEDQGPQLPDPVIYRLYLNHDIKVQITGRMPDSIPQYWPRFWFEFNERLTFIKSLTNNLLKKTPLEYQPYIKLEINYKDAEAIYRAVPKKGKVILEL